MIRRGVQVSPRRTAQDLVDAFTTYKCNIVRCQITYLGWPEDLKNPDTWWNWLMGELDQLDIILYQAQQMLGNDSLKIVLDIHSLPGGIVDGKHAMFTTNTSYQEYLLDAWKLIAKRYKNKKTIHVYGICNEPLGARTAVARFMRKAVRTIRRVDRQKIISVTCPGSRPMEFTQVPLFKGDNYIWYEIHMYHPGEVTHQGVFGRPYPVPYAITEGTTKRALKYLKKVIDFQKRHNATIYAGEFSCSTFASVETRNNYVKQVVDIFESYNWNWSYHAYKEADVWNIDDVAALLKTYWNKNI